MLIYIYTHIYTHGALFNDLSTWLIGAVGGRPTSRKMREMKSQEKVGGFGDLLDYNNNKAQASSCSKLLHAWLLEDMASKNQPMQYFIAYSLSHFG